MLDSRYSNKNLIGKDLSGQNLDGYDFTGSTMGEPTMMSDSSFDRSWFMNATMIGVKILGSSFVRSNFSNANLRGASLQDSNFRGAVFRGAKLMRSQLNGSKFFDADLTGAVFRGANITGADFRGADISGANFQGVKGEPLYPPGTPEPAPPETQEDKAKGQQTPPPSAGDASRRPASAGRGKPKEDTPPEESDGDTEEGTRSSSAAVDEVADTPWERLRVPSRISEGRGKVRKEIEDAFSLIPSVADLTPRDISLLGPWPRNQIGKSAKDDGIWMAWNIKKGVRYNYGTFLDRLYYAWGAYYGNVNNDRPFSELDQPLTPLDALRDAINIMKALSERQDKLGREAKNALIKMWPVARREGAKAGIGDIGGVPFSPPRRKSGARPKGSAGGRGRRSVPPKRDIVS